MMMRAALLTFTALLCLSEPALAQQLAFPGAVGFGRLSQGGRGGVVYEVTTLADTRTPGTLRTCLEASGPRTCVFRVGGTIVTTSPLIILNPYYTIAGQTAPAPGITIEPTACAQWPALQIGSGTSTTDALDLGAGHGIVRYIRLFSEDNRQPCLGGHSSSRDGLFVADGTGPLMIDHVSIKYGGDENIGFDACASTIQWSIMAWGLEDHSKAIRGSGPAVLTTFTFALASNPFLNCGLTLAYNLMAHNNDRGPQVDYYVLAEVVNNYMYDPGSEFGEYRSETGQLVKINFVGNVGKLGQENPAPGPELMNIKPGNSFGNPPGDHQVYFEDNIPAEASSVASVFLPVDANTGTTSTPPGYPKTVADITVATRHVFPHPPPPAYPATAVRDTDVILGHVGAVLPLRVRDEVFLIEEQIPNGLGANVSIWTQVSESEEAATAYAAQFINIPTPIVPRDSDRDGMADNWERQSTLLDPLDPSDGRVDLDGDGWTELEEYLNFLAAPGFPPPP